MFYRPNFNIKKSIFKRLLIPFYILNNKIKQSYYGILEHPLLIFFLLFYLISYIVYSVIFGFTSLFLAICNVFVPFDFKDRLLSLTYSDISTIKYTGYILGGKFIHTHFKHDMATSALLWGPTVGSVINKNISKLKSSDHVYNSDEKIISDSERDQHFGSSWDKEYSIIYDDQYKYLTDINNINYYDYFDELVCRCGDQLILEVYKTTINKSYGAYMSYYVTMSSFEYFSDKLYMKILFIADDYFNGRITYTDAHNTIVDIFNTHDKTNTTKTLCPNKKHIKLLKNNE